MGLLEYLQQGSPADQTVNKIGPGRIKTIQGEGGLLRKRYPEVYGALAGLLGTAPDQMEGSVLDPNTARVRSGAEYTFPVGTAAQVLPIATKPLNALGAVIGKAAEPAVNRLVASTMQKGGMPAQLLQDMSQGTQSPLTVWHGSPHKFDKFDASKIGTGEGAQAYGHGLYLAESPEVAGQYQRNLGGVEMRDKAGKVVPIPENVEWVAKDLAAAGGDYSKVRAQLAEHGKTYPWPAEVGTKYINELEAAGVKPADLGSLYKVDLPDEHIARMLDWDAPYSNQPPEVQKALEPYFEKSYGGVPEPDQKLGIYVQDRMLKNGFAPYFSQDLQQAGVPGIKYLDGGSRADGTGSHNFVVFPGGEGLLTILERNGQPVNQLGGLLGAESQPVNKLNGLLDSAPDLSYQIEHKPMTVEGGAAPLHDLTQSFGDDVYGKSALQYYGSGDPREAAILKTMAKVRGNPDAPVTIYRGVPKDATSINAGDWVTLHPEVAQDYADLLGDGVVLSKEVPASHVTSWPDSLLEFGYHPPK